MASAPALSTETVYSKVEQLSESPTVSAEQLADVYYLDEVAKHIISKGYTAPCLQFPDDLIRDSAQIATYLTNKTGVTCYVLADTSYSSCCVDEIAAQHVHGDVIYHFGSACLNLSKSLPVCYVSRKYLNNDVEAIKSQLSGNTLVYPDTKYTAFASQFEFVALPYLPSATFIPSVKVTNELHTSPNVPNRYLSQALPDCSEVNLVYLSDNPSESLLLQWSTLFASVTVVNGKGERVNANPMLRWRYLSVQQIKSAGTIGILVNTLSLKDIASLLERTKRAISLAEKKYYMFVVGKPNVAKLGNFEAIDVWVILGCPQGGIILNQDEYFKPIVTPYELELAFSDTWTGKWLLDFSQVLVDDEEEKSEENTNKDSALEGGKEEPLFDLVTGKFVFNNTPLRQVEHLGLEGSKDVQISSSSLTIRNTVSSAAKHLQQRTWQGLGSDHADIKEEFAELKKGRSGIARNYQEQT